MEKETLNQAFVLFFGSVLLSTPLVLGPRGPENRDKEDHKETANRDKRHSRPPVPTPPAYRNRVGFGSLACFY
jgi:hypothetical protein